VDALLPTNSIPALPDGAAQVWWAVPAQARVAHDALLSPDDLERRARLRRADDRDRLTVAYALARLVLARHLGAVAEDIRFERTCLHCGGAHGKPRVAGDAQGLRFSLSHSGDRVALGVLRGAELGVDVEQLKPDLDLDALAGATLAGDEAAELARVGAADRTLAFLTYWTRKEAVLKATGEGLQVPLKHLTVSGLGTPPELRAWTGRPEAPAQFRLYDLAAGDGHLASLATVDHPAVVVHEFDAGAVLSAVH